MSSDNSNSTLSSNIKKAFDLLNKLNVENAELKLELAKANHRITMLESELMAAEDELAMYEDDEKRHV